MKITTQDTYSYANGDSVNFLELVEIEIHQFAENNRYNFLVIEGPQKGCKASWDTTKLNFLIKEGRFIQI